MRRFTQALAIILTLFANLALGSGAAIAQPRTVVYDAANGGALHLLVWDAPQSGSSKAPALLLFHGGAFRHGTPGQFAKLCEYISAGGIVCISAEYSLTGGEGTLGEAKAAVAWVRNNAPALSVDPQKIAVGGSSAGAYLAASTAIIDADGANAQSMPSALILISPLLHAESPGPSPDLGPSIRAPLPPALLLHGTADHLVPIAHSERFVAEARAAGSQRIQLVPYPGRDHEAFNFHATGNNDDFFAALDQIQKFLMDLGWISSSGKSSSVNH